MKKGDDTVKRYLLIASSSEGIEYTDYETKELAQSNMEKAYEQLCPENLDSEWEEMSYVSDGSAVLYANGEDVYFWEIVDLYLGDAPIEKEV